VTKGDNPGSVPVALESNGVSTSNTARAPKNCLITAFILARLSNNS
jgi:hypothetical protein